MWRCAESISTQVQRDTKYARSWRRWVECDVYFCVPRLSWEAAGSREASVNAAESTLLDLPAGRAFWRLAEGFFTGVKATGGAADLPPFATAVPERTACPARVCGWTCEGTRPSGSGYCVPPAMLAGQRICRFWLEGAAEDMG
jgi:hypothetical protein